MIIKKISSLFSLKLLIIIGLIVFSSHFLLNGISTYAFSPEDIKDNQNLASFILGINGALNRILWPILIMIGGLLDNSILFGSGMDARLKEIWIPIRNLVNLIFVIGLVGIAIYNMTSLADDNASIKGLLPKLVIGIIAINFSFLGIKVFLDAINVATSAVFALPDQVSEGLAQIEISNNEEASKSFCLAVAGQGGTKSIMSEDEDAFKAYQEKVAKNHAALQFGLKTADECDSNPACEKKKQEYLSSGMCDGFKLSSEGQKFFERFGGQNVALAMAIELGGVMYYQDVDVSVNNVEKVLISIIISLVLYTIYAVTFIALFIVLLARLLVLWVIIAVSPVIILASAIPVIGSKVSALSSAKDTFIQNAIAPLIISVAMSIGWIMLKAMKSIDSVGSETLSAVYSSTDGSLPIVGLTTMQDIIVGIGVIAITWVAISSAMSKTIAKSITDSMYGMLEQAGKSIIKYPYNNWNVLPVKIPGVTGGASLGEVANLGNRIFQPKTQDRLSNVLLGGIPIVMNSWKNLTTPQERLALITETPESANIIHQALKNKPADELSGIYQLFDSVADTENKGSLKVWVDNDYEEQPWKEKIKPTLDSMMSAGTITSLNKK